MPSNSANTKDIQTFFPEQSLIDSLFQLPALRDLPFRGLLEIGLKLLLLCLLFIALNWVLHGLIQRTGDRLVKHGEAHRKTTQAARVRTLTSLGQSASFYTLLFLFAVGALGLLGVNVLGLVGTAGVAGLAVGFGAQKLVKDIISGFISLLEDQYAVGEYVTAGGTAIAGGGVTGTVEDLGIRSTRLRDDDGRLYILSNGDITQVCNHSRGAVLHSFEIGIASTADVAEAIQVLNSALHSVSESLSLAGPASVAGVSATDAVKTTLRISFRATVLSGTPRPADIILTLREAARIALVTAKIALA